MSSLDGFAVGVALHLVNHYSRCVIEICKVLQSRQHYSRCDIADSVALQGEWQYIWCVVSGGAAWKSVQHCRCVVLQSVLLCSLCCFAVCVALQSA